MMTDWQPIDTAPKDKLFLGYGEIISGVFGVDICMWWKGNELNRADWTDNSGHYLVKLTHWMPLPSAPPEPHEEPR